MFEQIAFVVRVWSRLQFIDLKVESLLDKQPSEQTKLNLFWAEEQGLDDVQYVRCCWDGFRCTRRRHGSN